MKRAIAVMIVPMLLWGGTALATYLPADPGDATGQAAHGHGEASAHAAHDAHAVPVVGDDHVRWTPDEPLRKGMRRMAAVVEALGHREHGHLDANQVRTLAAQVDAAAAYMISNCTLEPEPDAALHGLLAQLMGGARRLADDPGATAAIAPMREALAAYARMFDDPDFVVPAGG